MLSSQFNIYLESCVCCQSAVYCGDVLFHLDCMDARPSQEICVRLRGQGGLGMA
jgi:hypothetical protein